MSEYNKPLTETTKHLTPPIGFSNYETPKEDSSVIRQNNTIIQLLVQVLEKLDTNQSNKEILLASSGIVASSKSINLEKWNYLKALSEETSTSN
jgi:hypothetical protein